MDIFWEKGCKATSARSLLSVSREWKSGRGINEERTTKPTLNPMYIHQQKLLLISAGVFKPTQSKNPRDSAQPHESEPGM